MLVQINDPLQATVIFSLIFFLALCLFVRPREIKEWFPASLTVELKGLAILMIVFSHIGYFLVSDTRFLWPLSIMAGVGVNLFLFLSGFGLAASQIKKELNVGQFYSRRLLKLFIPLWFFLIIVLPLDVFVLKINYSWDYIVRAFLGIFTHANLYTDINSPLWYLTFLIGYYLLFPLVFFKKYLWLSALILYLAGYLFVYLKPSFFDYVLYMYKVHIIAFPLGVLTAWVISKLKSPQNLERLTRVKKTLVHFLFPFIFLGIFIYANINSGVGGSVDREQLMSILAVLAICAVFIFKKFEFKLLSWFGIYSYEIYLFHWPLMYRYDIFYKYLPVWLATALYLGLFIGLGLVMARVIAMFTKKSI